MKQSESRILTTHTGSLPRPKPLVDLQLRMSRGEPVDSALLAAGGRTGDAAGRRTSAGVRDRYRQRRRATARELLHLRALPHERLRRVKVDALPPRTWRAIRRFASCSRRTRARACTQRRRAPSAKCATSTAIRSTKSLRSTGRSCRSNPCGFVESFWTAPSPGIVACGMQNDYYGSLAGVCEGSRRCPEDGVRDHRRAGAGSADRWSGPGDGAAPAVRRSTARRVPRLPRSHHRTPSTAH